MKLKILFYSLLSILLFLSKRKNKKDPIKANYLDFSKRDQFTGGIK
jgi:proline iminopeptidase